MQERVWWGERCAAKDNACAILRDGHSLAVGERERVGSDGGGGWGGDGTGRSHVCTFTPFSAAMAGLLSLQLQTKLRFARV